MVSQAPTQQQAPDQGWAKPGPLQNRLAAMNINRAPSIAPSRNGAYQPSRTRQHRPEPQTTRMAGRDHNAAPSLASFQTGKRTTKTAFTTTSRAPTRLGRYVNRSTFKPGVILRIPHHVPALPGSKIEANALSESSIGEVCSKFRPFIIVSSNEETYQALALYTYGGSGTEGVMCKDEYISVRDHRYTGTFAKMSQYEPLVTGTVDESVRLFKQNSVCHVVGIFTFSYFTQVQLEGRLNPDSTVRLARLKNEFDAQVLKQALEMQDAPQDTNGAQLKE